MKIIGLDIGEKRIGVALVDTSVKIASPHSTILADGTELDQIKRLMSLENTNFLVAGLPRNSKGEETAQSQIVRLFALQLESRGAKIKFQDESLTSVLAERRLKLRKKPYKKEDIDAEAAAIILQDFIESYVQPTKGDPEDKGSGTKSFRGEAPRSKALSPRSFILPALLVMFVAAVSGASIWFASGTLAISNNPLRRPFTISPGDSTQQIAQNLETAGLIKDPMVFTLAARIKNASIPAKTHFIASNEDVWQVLDQLSDS